jgi:hypothetical protein
MAAAILTEVHRTLRIAGDDMGDNDWPKTLHPADASEKTDGTPFRPHDSAGAKQYRGFGSSGTGNSLRNGRALVQQRLGGIPRSGHFGPQAPGVAPHASVGHDSCNSLSMKALESRALSLSLSLSVLPVPLLPKPRLPANPVTSSILRSDHPGRPSARTYSLFSSLKTLLIPAMDHTDHRLINASGAYLLAARFQVPLSGRFWVPPKALANRAALAPSASLPRVSVERKPLSAPFSEGSPSVSAKPRPSRPPHASSPSSSTELSSRISCWPRASAARSASTNVLSRRTSPSPSRAYIIRSDRECRGSRQSRRS